MLNRGDTPPHSTPADRLLISIRGDEAAAAHEESEEAAAPEKKTKRSKRAGQGDRMRSGSAGGWTAPSGSGTLPSSYVMPIVLDPNDGL